MAHGQHAFLTRRKHNSDTDFKLQSNDTIDSPSPQRNRIRLARGDEQKTSTNATYRYLTGVASAVTYATLPRWTNLILMSSLIFGGCCANVFALEAIIKDQPSSGLLITFAQFLLTSLITFPTFISLSAGPQSLFLSPRAIPLRSWLVYTGFFATVNLLNNWAFAYKISVPLHIILRSGGPVASMGIGFLFNGRRYSRGQILAVLMLTLGVVTAALADARTKGQAMNVESNSTLTTLVGLTILALAMILSAFQGIYADRLYETHGRDHWKEALFYSHTLSIPLFLPTYKQLLTQWRILFSSDAPAELEVFSTDDARLLSHASIINEGLSNPGQSYKTLHFTPSIGKLAGMLTFRDIFTAKFLFTYFPTKLAYLLINALTQYLCIRGVHLLSAKSSSLTVTVVLNIRKLVSLLLSIYIFGNALSPGVLIGALFVFIGGALYGFEGARSKGKTA